MAELPSARIRGLDGLRAIAVVMVFMEHRLKLSGAMLGATGVYLFVLSGYLIIGILNRERKNVASGLCTAKAAWMRFTIRRALRILPIYYLAIAIVVMLNATVAEGILSTGELPWLLTFTTNFWVGFINHHWTPALSHFWSLAVEEQFYLVTAPIIILGVLTTARLCFALLALSIASICMLSALSFTGITLLVDPLFNFGLFAFGGLLHSFDRTKIRRWLPPGFTEALLATLLVLPWLSGLLFTGLAASLAVWAAGTLMALLIFSISTRQNSPAVSLLEWGPIAALGRISYGVYVYHYILSAAALSRISGGIIDLTGTPQLLSAAVLFALTILVARVSWSLVEEPVLALKSKFAPELHGRAIETGQIASEPDRVASAACAGNRLDALVAH